MLTYLSSSIWASLASACFRQTPVNTANVVDAMGKGIALGSKRRMFDVKDV